MKRAISFHVSGLLLASAAGFAQPPAPAPVKPVLAYRFDIGHPVIFDTQVSVDSGYGDFSSRITLDVQALKRYPEGSVQVRVTVTYFHETTVIGKDKTTFDSTQDPKAQEDDEYAALRKLIGRPICAADVAPDGTVSRVIFSEDAMVIWKQEGAGTIERARDAFARVLPKLTGKPATVGDTWSDAKNPVGPWLPLGFKFNYKVDSIDPATGMANIVLADKLEAGESPTKIRKFELRNSSANVTFDAANGKLKDSDISGSFLFAEGEGDLATEASYKFKVKTVVR